MSNQRYNLQTVEGLLSYLHSTPFAAKSAVPLSGGLTNCVYRIFLETPYEGKSTLAVKHSNPYISLNEQEKMFPGSRQIFEVGALRRVRKLLPADAMMTVPSVYHFDDVEHVIIMEDAGDDATTLKQLILDRALDVPLLQEIGRAVGFFLAQLHTTVSHDEEALEWASGNTLAREISAWATYGRLVASVDGSSTFPALNDPPLQISPSALATIKDVARIRAEEIMSSCEAFTMGDFWPGNILIVLRRDGIASRLERILVVDWELCKANPAGLDVGQFCGDLRVLLQSNVDLLPSVFPLVDAFVTEYADKRTDEVGAWASIAAIHVGVHMATWGPWIQYPTATRESTRAMVGEGVKYIEEGCTTGNWTASRLAGLLSRGLPSSQGT